MHRPKLTHKKALAIRLIKVNLEAMVPWKPQLCNKTNTWRPYRLKKIRITNSKTKYIKTTTVRIQAPPIILLERESRQSMLPAKNRIMQPLRFLHIIAPTLLPATTLSLHRALSVELQRRITTQLRSLSPILNNSSRLRLRTWNRLIGKRTSMPWTSLNEWLCSTSLCSRCPKTQFRWKNVSNV